MCKGSYIEEVLKQVASVHAAKNLPKTDEKKKDKKRKRADAASAGEEDTIALIFEKTHYHSTEATLREVQVIQIFLEYFIGRRTFFSAMAISEAIMTAIPNLAMICALIRLVTAILHDHFHDMKSDDNSTSEGPSRKKTRSLRTHYHFSTFSSHQLGNLLTFIEGVMDGCFLSFALQISPGSSNNQQKEILKCLTALIHVIQAGEESFQSLLSLNTLTTVYKRISKSAQLRALQQSSQVKSSNESKPMSESAAHHELQRKPALEFYVQEMLSL